MKVRCTLIEYGLCNPLKPTQMFQPTNYTSRTNEVQTSRQVRLCVILVNIFALAGIVSETRVSQVLCDGVQKYLG